MKVHELMTTNLFTVNDSQTVNDAAQLMWEHDCGCIPVLQAEGGKLAGVITDRDIAMAGYTTGERLQDIAVTTAFSSKAIVASPDDEITDVEEWMQANQVRRIPVVNELSEVIGIVSLNDIAIAANTRGSGISSKQVASTLSAICRKSGSEGLKAVAAA
jgi:CBS domain-containing protein